MKHVRILDTTLREGEQTPGVSFSLRQKLKIARALDYLGVSAIEVGHPGVSRDIDEFIAEVKGEGLKAELIVHCRACERDVEAALATGIGRVAVFLGASRLHLEEKLGTDRRGAVATIERAVGALTAAGRRVRFTAEDASRADFDTLVELCEAAVAAGADTISLPDTVGIARPDQLRSLFGKVKSRLPGVKYEAHCHNDLGLAVANSLAALEGGADCLHTTINGLGERTGLTPLCNLAVALKVHYNIDTVDLKGIHEISRMVADFTGIQPPPNQPVVGEHAFSHKAGVHTDGVLKHPDTYEPFAPELVNRERSIIVDKYTGRRAVKARLEGLGVSLAETALTDIVSEIKGAAAASVSDEELLKLTSRAG